MRQSGQDAWWRKSKQLAALTLAVTVLFAFLPWLFGAAFDGRTILGLPLPFFLFVLGLPIAVLVAVFWFARRQLALDHRYDVTGNQG